MARLYANENFPLPVVLALRALGHDCLTIHETGRAGEALPDADVLRFAHADGRVLLTLNRRDFVRLHLDGQPHCGIVARTFDADFVGQAERIHQALAGRDALAGALLRVNRPSGG
jgi:hypothetical protein